MSTPTRNQAGSVLCFVVVLILVIAVAPAAFAIGPYMIGSSNTVTAKTWQDSEIQGKLELQKALFPDGLVWSHVMGFLNHQNKWVIEDLMPIFQEFTRTPMTVEQFIVRFGVPDGI